MKHIIVFLCKLNNIHGKNCSICETLLGEVPCSFVPLIFAPSVPLFPAFFCFCSPFHIMFCSLVPQSKFALFPKIQKHIFSHKTPFEAQEACSPRTGSMFPNMYLMFPFNICVFPCSLETFVCSHFLVVSSRVPFFLYPYVPLFPIFLGPCSFVPQNP